MKKHIAIADCFNKAPTSAAMITKTEKKMCWACKQR